MQEWIITDKSTSYKFLDRYHADMPRDFCSYYKNVLCVAFVLFIVAFAIMAAFTMAGLILSGIVDYNIFDTTAGQIVHMYGLPIFCIFIDFIMISILLFSSSLVFTLFYIKQKIKSKISKIIVYFGNKIYPKNSSTEQNPKFFKTLYKSIKGRYCPLIRFETKG